mmetsp:Transcript_7796/g.11448  ORF Transcript_7796/g.11448 Transcript_7796/m.11448 type:complete len:237 (-) Transcript_7796:150-860(-)|eukprot:CAMPEP_0197238964 /NCGR_PEP_ID=MMETSP1429-20130617/5467_1 /TAXON_ID=49237 /ORGANISM="Chaetoceros  sp., Strain UNC1202" /LENGTH=236 /DNA_ID=CAMNT_0042698259 /DNA_START=137 /DNA_END=847 /DNA_ORIENTATION=-
MIRINNLCIISTLLAISSALAFTTPSSPHSKSSFATASRLIQPTHKISRQTLTKTYASSIESTSATTTDDKDGDSDADDGEWEFEEYEKLTESDFFGSEWKVGTLMDGANKIDTTWCRCVVQDGEFIAVWGDNSKGKWSFDAGSQFFSITKDTFGGWFGKKIWAGSVEDYYFMEGTVRGWSPISSASVEGQWQMKRLGVDPDEAGTPPWFEENSEEEESNDGADGETKKIEGSAQE